MINFDCGKGRVQGIKCYFRVEMVFHGRDPDDEKRIVFRASKDDLPEDDEEFVEQYVRKQYEVWEEEMVTYLTHEHQGAQFDRVPYVISVYGVSLDSELPNLRFDVEKREISFEWEGMLDNFILERAEVQRRYLDVDLEELALAQEAMMGLLGPDRGMLECFKAAVRRQKGHFRDMRRVRLRRMWMEAFEFEMKLEDVDLKYERGQVKRIMGAEFVRLGKDRENDEGTSGEKEHDDEEGDTDGEDLGSNEGDESDSGSDEDDESDDGVIYVRGPSSMAFDLEE